MIVFDWNDEGIDTIYIYPIAGDEESEEEENENTQNAPNTSNQSQKFLNLRITVQNFQQINDQLFLQKCHKKN